MTSWFTICARNYLAYALTLHESLLRHEPGAEFTLFLADDMPDEATLKKLPFRVIPATALNLASLNDMTLRYNVMEFATAIKPACFSYLFEKENAQSAVYLDPDIYVTAPMTTLKSILSSKPDAVLTPHLLAPYEDDKSPDTIQILRAGTYNLGFAAFTNNANVARFLDWWQTQLQTRGHSDLDKGYFVDQKYMELAPSFLDNVYILRDKGYNAAYWNLHERPITRKEGDTATEWRAGGETLAFFHFSGIVPDDDTIFSKHQNRFEVSTIGPLRTLHQIYLQRLKHHRTQDYSKILYAFDKDRDGLQITDLMRGIYAEIAGHDQSDTAPSDRKFPIDYLLQHHVETGLTILASTAWHSRPDIQKAFPISTAPERDHYNQWFADNGGQTFGLPDPVMNAFREMTGGATNNGSSSSLIARNAARLINAAPSLRPVYKHVPTQLRSAVKTALYRTHKNRGGTLSDVGLKQATGTFDQTRKSGVHLFGYVRSHSGIGQGARGLVEALRSAPTMSSSLPLAVSALSNPQDRRETFAYPEHAPPRAGYRISVINANAEQVLRLEELIDPARLDGSYRIAFWLWELAKFPHAHREALSRVDEIWVPSQFVADALRPITNKPVHVLPFAIAPITPAAITRAHFNLPEDRIVFLTAFDVNSFINRKNPEAVIRAFRDAFDATSPRAPVLAIKVHGDHGTGEAREALNAHIGEASNIVILDQTLKRDEYIALHYQADAFVSLHRAEGFGFNMAEAMLIGKPVIATDYSGNRDFMDATNSCPISARLIDVPQGAYPHHEGQQWADPNHDEAVNAMRSLAGDASLRARLGKAGRATIETRYSSAVTGNAILRRLGEIDPDLKTMMGPNTPLTDKQKGVA